MVTEPPAATLVGVTVVLCVKLGLNAGVGVGLGTFTPKVAARSNQLYRVPQPGGKTPTFTAYVPDAAVEGTGQLTV